MTRRSICCVLFVLSWLATAPLPMVSTAAQERPRTADDEFLPIDELPPDERLPAAPFLIAAYSAAWIVVVGYLWSIWQRLRRVEREVVEVSRRIEQGSRSSSTPPTPPDGRGTLGSRGGMGD